MKFSNQSEPTVYSAIQTQILKISPPAGPLIRQAETLTPKMRVAHPARRVGRIGPY